MTEPAAQQTLAYKPGAAVLGMLRLALRETVFIGAIAVFAVWAARSYYSQYTPDKVSSICNSCHSCHNQASMLSTEVALRRSYARSMPLYRGLRHGIWCDRGHLHPVC